MNQALRRIHWCKMVPWPLPFSNNLSSLSNATGYSVNGCRSNRIITETTDVYDANSPLLLEGKLRVLLPLFQPYGKHRAFNGQVITVKAFEDNALAIETVLKTNVDGVPLGEGKVLVIDGGGSLRSSLVGSVLAKMAYKMHWEGILVNGCIRDVDEINSLDIGIRALGSVPIRSSKKGGGEKHVTVQFAGALIRDGDWLCADSNGILVADHELSVLGPLYCPVLRTTPKGASFYSHVMADYTSPVEPHRLFKAHCLDDNNFMPKFLPESFKNIEFVQGEFTARGCIKQVNFTKGKPFKNLKIRVDELDIDNFYIKYTSIEGDILDDKWDYIVHEIKVGASITGSHFKMIGYYYPKKDAMTTEDDVKVHQEGLKIIHKVTQETLLLYPDLYA